MATAGDEEALPPRARRRRVRGVLLVVAVVVAVVVVRAVALAPFGVAGSSMRPTLHDGDVVLVLRTPLAGPPARGDLVVLDDPDGGRSVKRVVGVGGDRVGVRDAVLEVDGAPVAEPWVDRASIDGLYFGPVLVPDGEVLVMGDDRATSVDGREWGSLPADRVVGRVLARVWPPR